MNADLAALMAERYGPTPDELEGRRRLAELVAEAESDMCGEWVTTNGIKVWRAA